MATGIDWNTYPILKTYALLGAGSGTSLLGSTSISNVFYGFGGSISSNFTGDLNNVNVPTALNQLNTLIDDINNITGIHLYTSLPAVIDNTITFTPGKYKITGSQSISNVNLVFDAEDDPNKQFFIQIIGDISFSNVPSITLINQASNCNIFWSSNSISFFWNTLTPTPDIPGIFIGSSISFLSQLNPNINIKGHIYSTGTITFNSAPNTIDGLCVTVCYAENTLILTEKGYMPIQNIKVGDKIITKGKIHQNTYIEREPIKLDEVIWISKFKVNNMNSESRPICIKKHALGLNSLFKDLYVSPNHSILINGKMRPARFLVNGETVYQDTECDEITYYHLECKEHVAIVANGVLAESYLDCNNRYVFEKTERLVNDNTLLVQ
jgi:hypothetical protein